MDPASLEINHIASLFCRRDPWNRDFSNTTHEADSKSKPRLARRGFELRAFGIPPRCNVG